jgi:hypothetical protein
MSSRAGRKMLTMCHGEVFCIPEQSGTPKTVHYPTCGIIL